MSKYFDRWVGSKGNYRDRVVSLIPNNTERFLDFGCNDGEFMNLAKERSRYLYGCDVDGLALEKAKEKYPEAKYSKVTSDGVLPFSDGFFDAVTMNSVLEHVPDEKMVLKEIHRILNKNGKIIITVPHNGMFAFADPGNIKFRFPRLHKFIHNKLMGKSSSEYNRQFEGEYDGMIGCHTNEWHVHYSKENLEKHLKGLFKIEQAYGFRLLHPIYMIFNSLFKIVFKKNSNLTNKLAAMDDKLQAGRLSDYMLLIASKIT